MLSTLALVAALSFTPVQGGGLTITNDRITFGGEFGPVRPDNRFLPGDRFYLAFDINGLTANSQGRVEYLMGMTVIHDASNKVLLKNDPVEQGMTLPLGASKLPARAFVLLGTEIAKGSYTCRVTVIDKATNATKTVEKKFVVLDPGFGIVDFATTYDRDGNIPAPMLGVAGQSLWLHFFTVGFDRHSQTKQPHNVVEIRVIDLKTNQPTTADANSFEIRRGVEEEVNGLEWRLPLPLNRPGSYRIELKAKDMLNGREYKMSFSVAVYESVK